MNLSRLLRKKKPLLNVTKKALRCRAKNWVKNLSNIEKLKLDQEISRHIKALCLSLKTHSNLVIGVYTPMIDEVNWEADFNVPESIVVSYPLATIEKNLEYWVYEGVTQKEKVVPDFILVPGLMFSEFGDRLGRGGGYFDRFLPCYKGIAVGICYGNNLSTWEIEAHDHKVHGVITEKGLIDIAIGERCEA